VITRILHHVGECPHVAGVEGVEEQLAHDLDVAGQDLRDAGAALVGDVDDGGALVVRGRRARDESASLAKISNWT
jgi:hypothetical protein